MPSVWGSRVKKQLVAGTVVFVIGFGIGLGLTYLLLAKSPKSEDTQSPTVVNPSEETATSEEAAPTESEQKSPTIATNVTQRPAESETKPTPVAAEPKPTAPPPAAENAETAEAKPEKPLEADKPSEKSPKVPAEPPPKAPPEAKTPAQWWTGLKGKTCKLNLGNARALVVRQGGLKDGDVVDWISRFGRNPRIGLIAQTDNLDVLVHGVGVSNSGIPTAAMITFEKQGRKTTGIVALYTQGLKVSLKPID